MNDILKNNYTETSKVIQNSYLVGYISVLSLLGFLSDGSEKKFLTVPFFDITLPVFPALIVTVGVYFGAGLLAAFANYQRIRIRRLLNPELVHSLDTYPVISNGCILLRFVTVSVPFLIFFVVFSHGKAPMSLLPALGSTFFVSSGFICSLLSSSLLNKLDAVNAVNWRR